MIKNIIFDFGDVFINLDKPATLTELSKLGEINDWKDLTKVNQLYETGEISTEEFLQHYHNEFPNATKEQLIDAWNAILIDFPEYRLDFLEELSSKQEFNLILLSNTNALHINWIKENISFYNRFKSCFKSFYLSHEIHLRKPNTNIFEFVLEQHQIQPSETIFIDDTKENTDAAFSLGIHVWNNNPKTEDITNLFTIKSNLF
ncbi:HAD family phosphatase [Aquimarina sp. D1M17]|uniref:HAD family hydrolase n=1 Tax=Aquimarina acroporae TaxID=2937283 RepID=UPI0020BFF179|nr:HAD family phosphatase [Aquimarina acroporae]MCK8523985.1 HAD family phosphatase [Aquimarina acroporae]